MNPILILREEIICLVLLLFFLVTACCYKTGRDGGSFLRLAVCAMGHVAFEILVILAMNPPGRVGDGVNRGFHACYHLFAVGYAYEFFCCTARIGLSQAAARRARYWALPALLLFAAALPFLPLYYLLGDGIYYGMGPFIAASYLAAMLYFAASAAILFARRRSIPGHVQLALLPMLVAMMATVTLQWAVPELFFSGGRPHRRDGGLLLRPGKPGGRLPPQDAGGRPHRRQEPPLLRDGHPPGGAALPGGRPPELRCGLLRHQ